MMSAREQAKVWLLCGILAWMLAPRLCLAQTAPKKIAIVIGVDDYPNLGSAATLSGCTNDARLMASRLAKYGFATTILQNPNRAKIISALTTVRSQSTANTSFLLYFAGHGSHEKNEEAYILPSDSRSGNFTNDISASELAKLVTMTPAENRTLILDCCFSGAMMRSVGKGASRRKSRYFSKVNRTNHTTSEQDTTRRGTGKDLVLKSRSLDFHKSASTASTSSALSPICYFVAAKPDQLAQEDQFGTESHGIFTHALAERLDGSQIIWGDLQTAVTGDVAQATKDQQHPEISPAFSDEIALGGPVNAAKRPADTLTARTTLWDVYNTEVPNPAVVDVILTPDHAVNHIGENLSISVTAGQGGYLVVLERGASGNVNLICPETENVALPVVAGQSIDLGEFTADKEGNERVKAILFSSAESAQVLLDTFGTERNENGFRFIPLEKMRSHVLSKDLKRTKKKNPSENALVGISALSALSSAFYTDDVIFEVVP